MSKWESIEIWKVQFRMGYEPRMVNGEYIYRDGDARIIGRERITGEVEVSTDHELRSAWILRSKDWFKKHILLDFKNGGPSHRERERLSDERFLVNVGMTVKEDAEYHIRLLKETGKKDAKKIFNAKVGDVITLKWTWYGETFVDSIRRVE
jgi:hypothetical protein